VTLDHGVCVCLFVCFYTFLIKWLFLCIHISFYNTDHAHTIHLSKSTARCPPHHVHMDVAKRMKDFFQRLNYCCKGCWVNSTSLCGLEFPCMYLSVFTLLPHPKIQSGDVRKAECLPVTLIPGFIVWP
jgi:hypothetical protein